MLLELQETQLQTPGNLRQMTVLLISNSPNFSSMFMIQLQGKLRDIVFTQIVVLSALQGGF